MMTNRDLLLPALAMLLTPLTSLSAAATEPEQTTNLPKAITSRLTADYPGWRIPSTPDSPAGAAPQASPNETGSVLLSDFDGDGRKDYAVLIEYEVSSVGAQSTRFCRAIVFLRTAAGYRSIPLTPPVDMAPQEWLHLRLIPKGTSVSDFDNNYREFISEQNAVEIAFDHSGPCTTYLYRRGKFVSFWTCD